MRRRRPRLTPPTPSHVPPEKSRRKAPFRVPWVRRCEVQLSDGSERGAFIVNINEYGAYIADDTMPLAGQGLTLRFGQPDSEHRLEATGAVAWLNPRQDHPVHSLPPGYAMKFDPLRPEVMTVVMRVMDEYVRRTGVR